VVFWLRARLPTRRAQWNRRERTPFSVPACVAADMASRTCPRIWDSPRTIESMPAATRNSCRTASSWARKYVRRSSSRVDLQAASASTNRSISATSPRVVVYSSVRLQVGRTPAPPNSSCRRARASGSSSAEKATFSRTSTGAVRWLMPTQVTTSASRLGAAAVTQETFDLRVEGRVPDLRVHHHALFAELAAHLGRQLQHEDVVLRQERFQLLAHLAGHGGAAAPGGGGGEETAAG